MHQNKQYVPLRAVSIGIAAEVKNDTIVAHYGEIVDLVAVCPIHGEEGGVSGFPVMISLS